MSTVFVVVREDLNTDTTTVERVFQDGTGFLGRCGHSKAMKYIADRDPGPGVDFFIEEMLVY